MLLACTFGVHAADVQTETRGAGVTVAAPQQNQAITGKVTDAKGEPVIGANVIEKGTTNGTTTDIDGLFSLNAKQGSTLVISYIGYVSQEVKANPN